MSKATSGILAMILGVFGVFLTIVFWNSGLPDKPATDLTVAYQQCRTLAIKSDLPIENLAVDGKSCDQYEKTITGDAVKWEKYQTLSSVMDSFYLTIYNTYGEAFPTVLGNGIITVVDSTHTPHVASLVAGVTE